MGYSRVPRPRNVLIPFTLSNKTSANTRQVQRITHRRPSKLANARLHTPPAHPFESVGFTEQYAPGNNLTNIPIFPRMALINPRPLYPKSLGRKTGGPRLAINLQLATRTHRRLLSVSSRYQFVPPHFLEIQALGAGNEA